MNINPETDLDLEKLFLPAWAQEPATANRYAKFTGEDRADRRQDRGRGERRGPPPPRREGGRPEFGRGPRDDRPRGPRREGEDRRPPPGHRGGALRDDHRGPRRDFRREDRERREPPLPLPEINAALVPDERGVESLARQIKMTGRAYPLFDIAHLIIQKPERYAVRFSVKNNADGQTVQPLFLCALDDTLWLSEDEAVSHVLHRHFATFYQSERTAIEPPKGKYTFVAQCGMSGVILGPPNHHDYQNQLRKLHAERFARMPFEVYKARIKIVRDEEVVKRWVEEQSFTTMYTCLNVPEAQKLGSREEVEQHFRATHKETIIKPAEAQSVSGVACRSLRGGLGRVVQHLLLEQRRFPMQIATVLSQQFAQRGLQFFKVNKTVTHVSVARPHFLDLETTPVSEGVRRIVEFINAHPKCTRRDLIEALAPTPPQAPIAVAPVEGGDNAADSAAAPPKPPEPPEPTTEQTAMIADLHWLIHQGHVIEFANGKLDTAKKPLPRPPKPEAKATAVVAEAPQSVETATVEVPPEVAAPVETGEMVPDVAPEGPPPAAPGAEAGSATMPAETAPPASGESAPVPTAACTS